MKIRPSKNTIIPEGATHWEYGLDNPFFKLNGSTWYQFYDQTWNKCKDDRFASKQSKSAWLPKPLLPRFDTTNCQLVETRHGKGHIVGNSEFAEFYIDLIDNKFGYTPIAVSCKHVAFIND